MWIERKVLAQEIPAVAEMDTRQLCELLASLGFPVDGVAQREGTEALDVDITANRGDVMSHRGAAREIAAKLGKPLAPIPAAPLSEGTPVVEVRLESPACPTYSTAVLELGKGTTPQAAQSFLAALEASAKKLPAVDASNELLHRYGHPTHAFDADRIRGAVTVRWAKAGESVVTLDGVTRNLTSQDLIIADESGPIALAGVMGGDSTKVTEATTRVLLESAYFDAKTVRAMARRHSLHTDASHRFGRGADRAMPKVARDLLVDRLQAWCGAKLIGAWTAGSVPQSPAVVLLSEGLLNRVAGEPVSLADAAKVLQQLGCGVEVAAGELNVVPPSWRHDLSIAEDLAEEVLRLRGYERIPSVLPPLEGPPEPLSPLYLQRQCVSRRLAHLGFHQTVTYGFISPEADAAFASVGNAPEGRTLSNPLGQEYSVMRGSLLPSLRAAAEQNLRQGAREVRLFELAPTYVSGPKGPVERFSLGVVWGGVQGGEDYLSPARNVVEADLTGVAKALGLENLSQVRALGEGLFAFEVPVSALPEPTTRIIPAFRPFSRFPSVERDLSLLVDLGQSHAALTQAMKAALPAETLQDLRCVDVFRHKSLPEGRQAWLMRLRFQAERTLVGEEVDGWMTSALAAAESLGARLRA
ncbi:phenylalanine--tRNA ligase subunit beta [Geothrix sp. PMB-07]|uniref:phenylalanine--tRNA ligase subunit beta n=1 Tax=Geothrix sp. PMB-07 TaxID=3068640 RepID=UPI002741590E|nr:phenylalanine--tRNA ligase subunit beta [Geothrix sp. PMB-07]WLT31535.1 phenylalanine--tRNA ligase subunit beta [Geothrix sp. PMB-07]